MDKPTRVDSSKRDGLFTIQDGILNTSAPLIVIKLPTNTTSFNQKLTEQPWFCFFTRPLIVCLKTFLLRITRGKKKTSLGKNSPLTQTDNNFITQVKCKVFSIILSQCE